MCDNAGLFSIAPWHTITIFKDASAALKQEHPLPISVETIAMGVGAYETFIRELWTEFKRSPSKSNARRFIKLVIDTTGGRWSDFMRDVLGIEGLPDVHAALLKDEVDKHVNYLRTSLLPDLLKALDSGQTDFENLDYRVIFLYAGALWSFGFLSTVTFDGVEARDAADLFIFTGPNDDNTCDGPRGCRQHVSQVYTVAQILASSIVPGTLRCLTSCRHIVLPVASF